MRKILITGVSGTGKTTVCKRLKNLGFEATDIENTDGMFEMYHKGAKKIFVDYDNAKAEHIKNAEWLCDVEKLKKLVFDNVIVLQPDSESLNERLKNREGTRDIGNTQSGRDVVLGWKDWWEEEMGKKGSILINANGSPEEVVKKILEKC